METGQKTFQTNSKIDKLKNNALSIQVSLSGLSFCILNTEKNALVDYQNIAFEKKRNPTELLEEIKQLYSTNKTLQQEFSSVQLIHENEIATLVPKALFDEDFKADYLKFNSKILRNDYIAHDELAQGDMINVYVPYVNINNFLYDIYGTFEYNHYSTVLLNTTLAKHKVKSETTMHVNIASGHFEIMVIENKSLKLYNTFEFSTKEDFIYYVLFTAEQMNLDPETFSLVLFGNIEENDELYEIAYTYVRHVKVLDNKLSFELEIENSADLLKNFVLLSSL